MAADKFAPLLAGKVDDVATLAYPVIVSPKLDGIRTVIIDGKALSRNLKPIPNRFVQSILGSDIFNYMDGELIVGAPNAEDCYRQTSSGVMSHDGEPEFTFHVFDYFEAPHLPFGMRFEMLNERITQMNNPRIRLVPHIQVHDSDTLDMMENTLLNQGFEGLMVRSISGIYKYGRSTTKEGILLKLKRFEDAEAKIVGFEELMSNQNVAEVDELGHTTRSTHKENLVPMNTLGALVCQTPDGKEFRIGSGFDAATRQEIWNNKSEFLGSMAKYKHFPIGAKDLPRFPIYLGIRHVGDMS